MKRMIRVARETKTEILSFCLMCNHYHVLAKRCVGPLNGFTQPLNTSYAQYFNAKYDRVGHVFQGRPKLKRVLNDSYLKTVVRYIHLNPVKAGLVSFAGDYRWSSHHNYVNPSDGDFVNARTVLNVFGGIEQYLHFMGEASLSDLPEPGEFVPSEEDVMELDEPERPTLADLAGGIGLPVERLRALRDKGRETVDGRLRLVAVGLGEGYSGADIARFLGCTEATVSRLRRRLDVKC